MFPDREIAETTEICYSHPTIKCKIPTSTLIVFCLKCKGHLVALSMHKGVCMCTKQPCNVHIFHAMSRNNMQHGNNMTVNTKCEMWMWQTLHTHTYIWSHQLQVCGGGWGVGGCMPSALHQLRNSEVFAFKGLLATCISRLKQQA